MCSFSRQTYIYTYSISKFQLVHLPRRVIQVRSRNFRSMEASNRSLGALRTTLTCTTCSFYETTPTGRGSILPEGKLCPLTGWKNRRLCKETSWDLHNTFPTSHQCRSHWKRQLYFPSEGEWLIKYISVL